MSKQLSMRRIVMLVLALSFCLPQVVTAFAADATPIFRIAGVPVCRITDT